MFVCRIRAGRRIGMDNNKNCEFCDTPYEDGDEIVCCNEQDMVTEISELRTDLTKLIEVSRPYFKFLSVTPEEIKEFDEVYIPLARKYAKEGSDGR